MTYLESDRSDISYIIHIGRHKTGTTSLQYFLHTNRSKLSQFGFFYPNEQIVDWAHHPIARLTESSAPRYPDHNDKRAQLNSVLEGIETIAEDRGQIILLSSEGFQNCRPEILKSVLGSSNVKIVVYIREQYSYLITSYQQIVHGGLETRALESAISKYNPDYEKFLSSWAKVFGPNAITARIFDKSQLKSRDVVHDFLDVLHLTNSIDEFSFSSEDKNPSLGGVALELKRICNALLPGDFVRRKSYFAFMKLASLRKEYSIPPTPSNHFRQLVHEKYKDSNAKVLERFFHGRSFLFSEPQNTNSSMVQISPESICQVLFDLKNINYELYSEILMGLLNNARNILVFNDNSEPEVDKSMIESMSAETLRSRLRRLLGMFGKPNFMPDWNWNYPYIHE